MPCRAKDVRSSDVTCCLAGVSINNVVALLQSTTLKDGKASRWREGKEVDVIAVFWK